MFESCLLKYSVASNKYPVPSTTYTLKGLYTQSNNICQHPSKTFEKKTLWFPNLEVQRWDVRPNYCKWIHYWLYLTLLHLASSRVYCAYISVTTRGALYCILFHLTETCSTNLDIQNQTPPQDSLQMILRRICLIKIPCFVL